MLWAGVWGNLLVAVVVWGTALAAGVAFVPFANLAISLTLLIVICLWSGVER